MDDPGLGADETDTRFEPASPEVLAARARYPREVLLKRIAEDVRTLFPGRVERLVLYGSRARGDARDMGSIDDSDWDVAAFLRDGLTEEDRNRISAWELKLLYESWHGVSAYLFSERAYEQRTVFMHNLRFDAVDL